MKFVDKKLNYDREIIRNQDGKMNNKTLISVVMSVYNAEKYLSDSILSILKQTHKNIEFIIVNDGSTDGSLRIIQEYATKDKRIVLINQENIGLTKSLNKCVALATGQYIARQDSDDISSHDRLEIQLNAIENFNCDFIFSRAMSFTPNGYFISPEEFFINNFSYKYLSFGNVFVHGTFFCKTDILKKEQYDESIKYAQDYDLFCRLANGRFKFLILPNLLYFLRVDKNSISVSKRDEQNKYAKEICKKYFLTDKFFIANKNVFVRVVLKTLRKFIK